MQVPLEITYQDISKEDRTEEAVQERVDKQKRLAQDMISCRMNCEFMLNLHSAADSRGLQRPLLFSGNIPIRWLNLCVPWPFGPSPDPG